MCSANAYFRVCASFGFVACCVVVRSLVVVAMEMDYSRRCEGIANNIMRSNRTGSGRESIGARLRIRF